MSEDQQQYPSAEEMLDFKEMRRKDRISSLAKELFVHAVTAVDKDGRSVFVRYNLAFKRDDVSDCAHTALNVAALFLEQQQEYFK